MFRKTPMKINEYLDYLPDKPGIYIFYNSLGKPLYIGKAKSLKKRVKSYFQKSQNLSTKITDMLSQVDKLDFIVTDNEVEALILESTLIKEHRPKYNVNLKDDKRYPYIGISISENYPRVFFTRKTTNKNYMYFGPYTSAQNVRKILDILQKRFKFRRCTGTRPGKKTGSPCLNYHINRCLAPCIGNIKKSEYKEIIDIIIQFLNGRRKEIAKSLEKCMKLASSERRFEDAARSRDRLIAINDLIQKQKVATKYKLDIDVLAIALNEDIACVELFTIRGGLLLGKDSFILEKTLELNKKELLTTFIKQYYNSTFRFPKEIILSTNIYEKELIKNWLRAKREAYTNIKVPKKGEKKRLVELAEKNALIEITQFLDKEKLKKIREKSSLISLKDKLNLNSIPYRIECYDISTLAGSHSVGSMVVFINGVPKKSHYKRFKIKDISARDDLSMMSEVIERRFKKLSYLHKMDEKTYEYKKDDKAYKKKYKEFNAFDLMPDLVLIDGGRGQLRVTKRVLKKFGLENISVIGLSKKPDKIHLLNKKFPLILPKNSPALWLLERIRDEAHRFAISYHRNLRDKEMVTSILDKIYGVGSKRKTKLIKHFGSAEYIADATLQELCDIRGIPYKVAQRIYKYFHPF